MDDFGSSLERDYGLGGRKGRKSHRSGNNGGYLRFSESFGRNTGSKVKHEGSSSSYSGGGGGGYVGGGGSSRSEFVVPSTYSVYDEIFSSTLHSTIPVFEDVFRVSSSSRMKVSELRDNDALRGMLGGGLLRRTSSRVTYEDIFGDAPDEFSGPFLFTDVAPRSRVTPSSSRASSSGRQSSAGAQHVATPRKDAPGAAGSPTPRKDGPGSSRAHSEAPSPLQVAPERFETRCEDPSPATCKDVRGARGLESPSGHKEASGDSSAAHSESPTPRQAVVAEDSPDASAAQRPDVVRNVHHDSLENVQGSFLGTLKAPSLQENGGGLPNVDVTPSDGVPSQAEDVLKPEANDVAAHASTPYTWLSIGEVSLMTKPSDNPPPVRSAPGQSSAEGLAVETSQSYSGPPPSRLPPKPLVTSPEPVKPVETPSTSSELLARALKERSAEAEMSIREKVLDWQKHNLAQEQDEEDKQDVESVKSRTDGFRKLQAEEGDVMERVVAEVELAAAEQETMQAEEALRTVSLKHEQREVARKEDFPEAVTTLPSAEVREPSEKVTAQVEGPGTGEQDVQVEGTTAPVVDVNSPKFETPASLSDERHAEVTGGGDGETAEGMTLPQVQTTTVPRTSTDTESTIGIDTISSTSEESTVETTPGSGTAATKEGPAPETPDRVEEAHVRKSDVEPDVQRKTSPQKATSEQLEEERRQRERTLVARITAEVKERAALDAKAKAEKAAAERRNRRTKPRLAEHEALAKELEDSKVAGSSVRGGARVSLREQLEKERQARLARTQVLVRKEVSNTTNTKVAELQLNDPETSRNEARLRAERSLSERLNEELRARAARAEKEAKAERRRLEREAEKEKVEKEKLERERLQRIEMARERERERLERLAKEKEMEQQRLERELELEREIERKKDRVGLEDKLEAEAEASRVKMERIAVEKTTAEVRARAFERAAAAAAAAAASRPSSVPKQRFGNSVSMPSNTAAGNGSYVPPTDSGMRRTTSSNNLNSDRYSSSSSREFQQEFQELKGETPERRKARLERFRRTQNRAAQALAQKNKLDLELQSEQAERQRLSERLDAEIRRWSVGKDGNIRALLSTLQYVLWSESGWKQVTLTELINPAAVKKAYRRATLCVHPDKMQQKHASVQQKYIAEKVFHILQVAWNKFNSQEAL